MIELNINKCGKYTEICVDLDNVASSSSLLDESELEEHLFDILTGFYDGYSMLGRVNKEKLLASDVFHMLMEEYDEFFKQGE